MQHIMTRTSYPIEQLLQQRILILDGPMGTMIQQFHLTEEHYRGITLYGEYPKGFAGNNVARRIFADHPETLKATTICCY